MSGTIRLGVKEIGRQRRRHVGDMEKEADVRLVMRARTRMRMRYDSVDYFR